MKSKMMRAGQMESRQSHKLENGVQIPGPLPSSRRVGKLETYQEVYGVTQAGSDGYTCSNCGQWVWNNQYHYCGGYGSPQYTYYWTDRSQEIIDLLKEILEQLKGG
uniref:Uncharacterized protein n=1 Tax=viral metagenome TaxID=1070528 RepID=A0A6M3L054_9ZZZZ